MAHVHSRHPRSPKKLGIDFGWGVASLVALIAAGSFSGRVPNAHFPDALDRSIDVEPSLARQPVKSDPKSDAEPGLLGWYAVYSTATPKNEVRSHAVAPAFALSAGSTIDPAIAPSGFIAEYSGDVVIPEPGKYRFGVEAEGGTAVVTAFDPKGGTRLATATIDGSSRPAVGSTAFVALTKGAVQVSVKFSRRGDSAARLRTTWEMERIRDTGFRAEGVPIESVNVPKFGKAAASAALTALHGRSLLGELGCVACHATSDGRSSNTAVETRQAPLLGEIGRRANPDWILRWILDPQKVKPGTPMPGVFTDSPKDRTDAEAIVHFLVAPRLADAPTQPATKEEDVINQGRYLYHSVGCVACHGPKDSPQSAFMYEQGLSKKVPTYTPLVRHGDLSGKWRAAALAEFLRDPQRVHPGGRMPSMNLSTEEADLITTYLIRVFGELPTPATFKVDPTKVEVGKAAFAARGCAACHQIGHNLPAVASTLKAPALPGLSAGQGCLDPKDTKTPRYSFLSDEDRAAVVAGIAAVSKAQAAPASIDAMHRQIEGLNCRACHMKDGTGGPPKEINAYFRTLNETELGDEGRLPPNLSGVGFKLTTNWLRTVLTARGQARAYMGARMPQFGEAHVGSFADVLASESGIWPKSDRAEPKPTDEIVAAGRRLIGDTALNCISCHVFGDYPAAGTPGPDITAFAERLRYDWWRGYIMDPHRFKAGTRMPNFYATGTGAVKDAFGGDPDKQADAMWSYFNLGAFAPVPTGINTGKGLKLNVGDRPMVFRSFMKDAGSRGIAVGFPVGLHFAFDAGAARLVDAWRGAFLDASGAWAGRGGSVTDGTGPIAWTAPPGPTIVVDSKSDPVGWPGITRTSTTGNFRGYTLDQAGVPTFMYDAPTASGKKPASGNAAKVHDRFEPSAAAGVLFTRSFTLDVSTPLGSNVFVNAGKGKVSLTALKNAASSAHQGDDGAQWFELTPSGDGPVTFMLEYGS